MTISRRQGDFIMPGYVEAVLAKNPDISDVCIFMAGTKLGRPRVSFKESDNFSSI